MKVFEVVEPLSGGAPKHVALVAEGLSVDSFEVTLVYPDGVPAPLFEKLPSRVKRKRIPMVHEISPLRDLRTFLSLLLLFWRERPDVVHAHSSKAGFLARWAAWMVGVRAVYYTPHGFSFLRADVGPWVRRFFLLLERFCALCTDGLVAVSQAEAVEAEKVMPPHRIFVNPNGIPLPEAPSVPAEAARELFRVGTAGRLTPAKAPDVFFDIAERVCAAAPRAAFLWIGGGEMEADFARRFPASGAGESRIGITGWLEPEEALRRLASLDVFLMTSLWEGLPFALLEAMALGKPAVVLNRAGLGEVVRHGETGYVANTRQEAADCLLRLSADPALARRMGEAGRALVHDKYSAQAMVRRLAAYYRGDSSPRKEIKNRARYDESA